jgi:hypothetical protein
MGDRRRVPDWFAPPSSPSKGEASLAFPSIGSEYDYEKKMSGWLRGKYPKPNRRGKRGEKGGEKDNEITRGTKQGAPCGSLVGRHRQMSS